MTEMQLLKDIGIESTTVDVVFVTNQPDMPIQIDLVLVEHGLSFEKIGVEDFADKAESVDLIGTVVIDTTEIEAASREKFCLIVRRLEDAGIATIFLNNEIDFPFDDFILAALLESASIEEIWGRVESNVAYRKSNLANGQGSCHDDINLFEGLADDTAQQLKMAGQVQRDFFPTELPNIKSVKWATVFQPADWVSGDIYDVRRLDEQHIGFYIADAVGHSMPAALLTIFIKQAISMRETSGNDYRIFGPMEVITNLNQRMCDQKLHGCLFATCCYCLLNIRTMQLTYCRAGHPYPVVMHKGQPPVQLESTGGLLGVFAEAKFDQNTVQLAHGDKLFLYSDGIEKLIGDVDDDSVFSFTEEFTSLTDLPVEEMMEKFGRLAKARKVATEEIDDVTAVALEIQ